MRHDHSLMIRVLEGRLHGKKSRGRPRKGFLDDLIAECGATGYEMLKRMAKDRSTWRDTCSRTLIGSHNLHVIT